MCHECTRGKNTRVILIPVVGDMLQAQIYVPRNAHSDTAGGENFNVAIFFFNLHPQYTNDWKTI